MKYAIITLILVILAIPVIQDFKKIKFNARETYFSQLTGLSIHGTRSIVKEEG